MMMMTMMTITTVMMMTTEVLNFHSIIIDLRLKFDMVRCLGESIFRNFDFSKNHIMSKFNVEPVSGVNFTSVNLSAWRLLRKVF